MASASPKASAAVVLAVAPAAEGTPRGARVKEAQIGVLRELRVGLLVRATMVSSKRLQHGQQPQHLGALAAVAEQDGEIARRAQAEVAVQCLGGVEKTGDDARAVEGAGQFLARCAPTCPRR